MNGMENILEKSSVFSSNSRMSQKNTLLPVYCQGRGYGKENPRYAYGNKLFS